LPGQPVEFADTDDNGWIEHEGKACKTGFGRKNSTASAALAGPAFAVGNSVLHRNAVGNRLCLNENLPFDD
jgi:hypothetical protein